MNRLNSVFIFLSCVLPATSLCVAGDSEAKRQAFRMGVLLPVEGPILENATLLVRDGYIEKIVSAGEELPEGVELIDLGKSSIVFPTLVNPYSRLHEIDSNIHAERLGAVQEIQPSPHDNRKEKVLASFRHRKEIYGRMTETGYGAIALAPSGAGFLSGQACVVRPGKAREKKDLVLAETAYLGMAYRRGRAWRLFAERHFKKAFEQIKKMRSAKEKKQKADVQSIPLEQAQSGQKVPGLPLTEKKAVAKSPPPPDPLVEVLLGNMKSFLLIHHPADIDHGMRVLDKLKKKFRFVLLTKAQEPDVVEKLARRKEDLAGVILQPQMATYRHSSVYYQPARLFEEAGIPVAFVPAGDDFKGHREIFYFLAEMVKSGLSRDQVLRAVTLTPARFLGLDKRIGSIEVGKEASFVVFDDDPFNGLSRPKEVYHVGKRVYSAEEVKSAEVKK